MSNTHQTTNSATFEKDLRLPPKMKHRDYLTPCDRSFRCVSHGMRVGRQKGTRCFPRRNNPQTSQRSLGSTSQYSPCNMSSIIFVLLVHCLCLASGQNIPELPPIVFTQQPQAGSPEIQGNTKVLLCQATGSPPPVYRWKKDGNFITDTNITDTSLKISNIERSDDGAYQCIASNNPGAILSNKAHVRVAYMVPFASLSNTERTVDQGQAYIMDPPALESYPSPTIKWFEISTEMHLLGQESQHYHITLGHQLVILETQMSYDRKVYKARATNSYTGQTSDSQMFVLHVQSVGSLSDDIPPEIIIAPTHSTAVQGDDASVTLECVANARPINYLSMNWYRRIGTERSPIEQDYTKYIFSLFRRRLTIKIPDTSDTGVYECEVELNRPGVTYPMDTALANLTVLVKPSFATPPPSDISRDYGSPVEIPCHAVGIPSPTIVWYRNTEMIDFADDDRFSLLSSGSLRIDEVNPTDSAVYQCFASNGAGELNGATWLKVLSSIPEIVDRPQNQSVIAGDSARLMCDVTGAPRPTVTWYRVLEDHIDREILTDDNPRINILDRELLVPVTIVEDSGRYVCNATNTKGMDWAEAWVKVSLRTRIVGPPQDASVIKGSIHYMPCEVDRDPSVQVEWKWFQNDVHIPLGDQRRRIWDDGRLEIRSVRNEDIGVYRCDVTSIAGDDTATASVQVIELPYPPTISSMALNQDDVRAVDITWQAGFDGNTQIRYYIMQYRLVPTGETLLPNEAWQIASSSVAASARSFTVTGLQPARTYQFRISAVNDVGEGPASEASDVIEMPQQPPSGPPRGVVASPRSESSIILQWQPPDENRWNGPLQGYVIRYKPSGYPDSTLTYEPLDLANLHVLTGLIVFTEYEVAVAAYNAEGTGVYSDTITVRTHEGSPSQAPRGVTATAVSSTKIRLQWLPPDPQRINGINQGYKITARRLNTADPDVLMTVPSNTSNMLGQQTSFLENLDKFTEYEIQVLCFTSAGDGPTSQPVIEQTMEDVPDQVSSLTFANILDTSLQVIWTPPEHINGILVGYTLTYMKAGHVITMVTQEVGPTTLNYTIAGLTATTIYTIDVYARTRVGPGPPRSANIDSGIPPELPEPPLNLAITNIQATSVLLQFVPGFNGHTSISTWIVQGRLDGADWEVIYRESAPEATSILVQNLRPYTNYILRLIAENVAGQSTPSPVTREFQTIQAPPSGPPQEVTVRAVNETAIRATWKPLDSRLWNGEGRGYLVQYRISGTVTYNTIEVQNENANSYVFTRLEEYTEYDVRVASRNNVGSSVYSPLTADRTMESVPSSGPFIVETDALTSTSIRLTWTNVPERDQNGLILGYKVYYSAIEEDGPQLSILDTEDSTTFTVRLNELKKFTLYRIQILAYTRIGDGVLSETAAQVRTFEDVPGPPSGIYFPEVTHSTARVLWGEPAEPNGVIIGYRVAYRQKNLAPSYTIVSENLSNDTFLYYVTNLERTTYYDFNVTARTQLGWGVPGSVEVYTIINRRIPDPPSQPSIGMSQVGSDWVTINWQPGNDGYGPIRNYTIQYLMLQPDNLATYVDLPHYVPPHITAFTVEDLHANTQYQFRIAGNNDLGRSDYSQPSEIIATKQAAPGDPPEDLEVIPQTTTSVMVSWQPPPMASWNGPLLGYRVRYRNFHTDGQWQDTEVAGSASTSVAMDGFVLALTYEFQVQTYNTIGPSPWTSGAVVYMEYVPTEAPINFDAQTMGSTEIVVSWNPPPSSAWNGDLLGYKIFYWREEIPGQQVKTVAATETEAILEDLEMFTEYTLVMLAFNAAGDGPNTTIPITATTTEGVPGRPGPLKFVMTSLTTLNVSWTPPMDSNGHIESYEVSYYQDVDVDVESRNVQVRLYGDKHSYIAQELKENVLYVFSVKARTSIDWGEPRYGNLTTGPQLGSPGMPSPPSLSTSDSSVTLTWTNGPDGDAPVSGYIVQGFEKKDDAWKTLLRTSTPEPKTTISFYNLIPNTEYMFRVIALNAVGISAPSQPSAYLRTMEVDPKAFYEQWWFSVIVALTGFIFVIIVISLLCLTGQRRRKAKVFKDQIPKTTIRLEENHLNHHSMHQMQPMPTHEAEEAGFGTLESAASRRSHRRPPVPRLNPLPPYTRSPPRPSPGMVNYNPGSDDETKQFPDDGSSVSEKPSDVSSSEASDSEPETEKGFPPPEFTNHYVNGDVRQSWQRHQNPRENPPPPIYNYTDSEQDSQYAVTLNGGHVIMNNMAGSRAPLPGFSSFV